MFVKSVEDMKDNILVFKETSGFKKFELFFDPESVQHPAKANLLMIKWIIEKYSKEGDLICDPMSGTFSTSIIAGIMNRDAVGVEYEDKFYRMGLVNKAKFDSMQVFGGKGKVEVLKGDARELSNILEKCSDIVTSPPYGHASYKNNSEPNDWKKERGYNSGVITNSKLEPVSYSTDPENLGNQKGKTYLGEMKKVYNECFKVLNPGGKMVLITKNFVRKGVQIRLDLDTIRLCEEVGFRFVERWKRKLTGLSFWQINYLQKWFKKQDIEMTGNTVEFAWKWNKEHLDNPVPPALHEDILVFIKN